MHCSLWRAFSSGRSDTATPLPVTRLWGVADRLSVRNVCAKVGSLFEITKKKQGKNMFKNMSSLFFFSDRLVVDADALLVPFVQPVYAFVYFHLVVPSQAV